MAGESGCKIVSYEHHGKFVSVREDLKGKHRDHCLCYDCIKFKPGIPEENCPVANLIYAVCIAEDVVTPVWECKSFTPGNAFFLTYNDKKKAEMTCAECVVTGQTKGELEEPNQMDNKPSVEHKSTCAIHNNPPAGFSSEVTQCDCGAIVLCGNKAVEDMTTKELVES